MKMRWLLIASMFSLMTASPTRAQAPLLAPGEKEPLLRVEAGGPTSFVTALAFSPNGRFLYSGGWDKVVRVWSLNEQGQFDPFPTTYRVPIGPGLSGAINCIALSPDGTLLAVAGSGVFREGAGFRQPGWVVPSLGAMNADMLRDQGMIYVFDTRTQAVRLLRGHLGTVLSMTFAPGGPDMPPILVSAGREGIAKTANEEGVIRVWNAATGEELVRPIGDQPTINVRPSIQARRTGKRPTDLQVAFAWDEGRVNGGILQEGTLRVWNVSQGTLPKEKDGAYNNTLAILPESGGLITGSLKGLDDRLQIWKYDPQTGLQVEKSFSYPHAGEVYSVPRAIETVPSQPGAAPDQAAVVLRVPLQGEEYRLRLVSLKPETLGKINTEISLWKGLATQPAMAASSRGYLAVSGNSEHNIHIYAVQNLLKNQAKPQILHSVGATFRYVSFVTKGKELGLLLGQSASKKPGQAPREPQQGDLIFDFTKRPLTGDIREWQTAAPTTDGWQARLSYANDQAVLPIYQNQKLIREIKLAKGLAVTDYALLSPRPPLNVPILAVAYLDIGQPWLVLYDAKTGEQIRQFTGHADKISCLAFSSDGRLLASAAEDQTVCVWSLTTLDKILGKLGLLNGMAVKDQKGAVVVGKVHDDSPSRGKLAVGDVIEGVVVNEKLRPLKNARDFYHALGKMTPRSPVMLRVRGNNGARDVRLEVGQGVDERKPLFSLFVTQADRQWIGWNPIGRFESSGPAAEANIGWHFNTGEADAPTRFALAQEYSKKYYQEGVLKDLIRVDQGEIKKLPPPPPPPAPKIGLLIDEEGAKPGEFPEPDAQGRLRLRHPRATPRISIMGRPVDTLKSVTWKLDQGPEQPIDLTQVAGQELSVEKLEFQRGVHQIRVTAKTPAGEPGAEGRPATGGEYSVSVSLRYQPPAPLVKYTGEKNILVKEPKFNLGAFLQGGTKDEPVQVTVTQKAKGKSQKNEEKIILNESKSYKVADDPVDISQSLKLEPGYNLIEITAVNQGASGDGAEAETDRLALEINYFKDAPPPTIALRAILPQADGTTPTAEVKIDPGRPIRVHVPMIRLLGEVKGAEDEDLVDAKWAVGKDFKKLTNFEAMKKKLPIDEKIEMKPGTQIVRFLAKTATSTEEERSVTVVYQPLVPQISITSPRSGQLLKGEEESSSIELQASLGQAKDEQPFKPTILVNGRELPAHVDQASRTIMAKVPITPGTNRLSVKLGNDWGSTSTSDEVAVRYLRPPTIIAVTPEEQKEGVPFFGLEARVRSATPLLPASVHVFVNESERKAQIEIPDKPGAGNVWTLRLTHIPMDAHETKPTMNSIQLQISNEEAECEKAGTTQVVYQPKQLPPAVEFTQPVNSVSVTRSDFTVQFQVQSKTKLDQVSLLHERHEPISADVSKAEAQPDGSFLLTAEVPLKLDAGPNTLLIEALNKGGVQSSSPLEINYLYRPVRVAVDHLVSIQPGSKPMKAAVTSGGQIAFEPQEESRLRLRGRVLWDEADDQRLKSAKVVKIFVNDFQQLPALLEKPGDNPRERNFQTSLVLNRDQGNHIELELPNLAKEFNRKNLDFKVDCRHPERSQRLHLLIVSIQDKNSKPLEAQIRRAFESGNGGTSQSAKAFDPIYVYPSLVDYHVKPGNVMVKLWEIQNTIQKLSKIGAASSDVALVYYRGGEAVSDQGILFQSYMSRPGNDETPITCDDVVAIFAETPGAQILLMDVDRKEAATKVASADTRDRLTSWDQYYPRVGMLHYAWLGQPNAAKNPGLIQAIEKAMGGSSRLVEVWDGVGRFASSPDFQTRLLNRRYLPLDLKELAVR